VATTQVDSAAAALDTTAALATSPPSSRKWDGVYRFDLEGSTLELPDDDTQLRNALLGIYLASGINALTVAWVVVQDALGRFAKPSAAEDALNERKPTDGTSFEPDFQSDFFETSLLDSNPGVASRSTVAESRSYNGDFQRRLLAAIDDIMSAEEEAQRWYEGKLLDVIDAHMAHQKARIKEAWETTYDVGLPDKPGPDGKVAINSDVSTSKLTIRDQKVLTDVTRYGKGDKVQDGTTIPDKAPAVVAALHEVGTFYYEYKQQLEGRIKANKTRQREGAAALAIKDLPAYEAFHTKLAEKTPKHFIIWPTYRHVVQDKATDKTLTQEMQDRCTRLIIEALRKAWTACDEVSTNARAYRLFTDEKPKCVIGGDTLGVPASRKVVGATYGDDQKSKTGLLFWLAYPRPPPERREISRSPWLQAPFHGLMLTAAAAFQNEDTAVTTVDPVEHLRALFTSDADRKRLRALRSFGSFAARARQEMIEALLQQKAIDEKLRRNIALGVNLVGIAGFIPSGGSSLVVSGIVDAFLVAAKTEDEVRQWISAKPYSAVALDALAAECWLEPAVSELMAIAFEAGFQVAGDLIQEGPIAHFFAAFGLTELLAHGAGLIADAVTKGGSKP